MWLGGFLRTQLGKSLTKERRLALERKVPPLERTYEGITEFGLYLHIPFCRQICPYCPYNKELYHPHLAQSYAEAVKKEIAMYARLLAGRPVTSFYIGGGTPTTMLHNGLAEILERVYSALNMQCGTHMESHPNDLSAENLAALSSLGVQHLSLGVEALQEHHLRTLHRPYTVAQAKGAIERAVAQGFASVNVDIIFALPHQTATELQETAQLLVEMGVDQIAAYPLFAFPYTQWAEIAKENRYKRVGVWGRRRMLAILERIFYQGGYERTSVWAFTRRGVPKYCSVTVPLYVGLGASGSSYLQDVFYLNTFNVRAYVGALEEGRMPIALSLPLTEKMQMAGWLYWRLYETRFKRSDFQKRFGKAFDEVYGHYMRALALLGFLKDDGDEIILTDRGTYWLHVLEDLFSIDYISKLWGRSQEEPWPERVAL